MAGLNKVHLIGNLGRDPELRYTNGGTAVATLNIATTRAFTNRQDERIEETEWHRVVVWGQQAEHCNKYLQKGRQVYVEGRLQTRSYEDKEGVKRFSTEVVAESVQFLGARPGGPDRRGDDYDQREQSPRGQGGGRGHGQGSRDDSKRQERPAGGFDNYIPDPGDDDIPF